MYQMELVIIALEVAGMQQQNLKIGSKFCYCQGKKKAEGTGLVIGDNLSHIYAYVF